MNRPIALGIVVLAAGILWLLSAADVLSLSYGTWIGLILVLIGLAIALVRGRHGLLVVLGVLVAIAGLPALVIDQDVLEGGVGDEVERPTAVADLEPFHHGVGKLTVDLTAQGLDLDGVTVEASVGIGELVVLVPPDTDVSVDAHVGMGNAEALGETKSGIDVDLDTISGTSGGQELGLTLEVGIGDIRVQRGPGY